MSHESTPEDKQEEFHDTAEAVSPLPENAPITQPPPTAGSGASVTPSSTTDTSTPADTLAARTVSNDKRLSDSSKTTTASVSRPGLLSRSSSHITPPGTTSAASPAKDGKATPAPTAGATGWKGWLRSASSARTPSFRLEMPFGRSNTAASSSAMPVISATPHADLREQFEAIRLRADPELAQKVPVAEEAASDGAVDTIDVRDKDKDSDAAAVVPIDWTYWESVLTSASPRDTPGLMAHVQLGVPEILRGVVWQALAASKDVDLEEVYEQLSAAGETTAGEYDKQIAKDLKRMHKPLVRALEERSKVRV